MTDRYDAMSPRERGGKTYWTRIGTMFPSKNGDGFNLVLDALPLPDKEGQVRVSMFPPKERDTGTQERTEQRGGGRRGTPADLDEDIPFQKAVV